MKNLIPLSPEVIKSVDIPEGFQLTIRTWENDGDHYKSEILSGLTEPDVLFYQHLLSHFVGRNNGGGFGNSDASEVTDDMLHDLLIDMFAQHPEISEETKQIWALGLDEPEDIRPLLQTYLLGYPEEYDDDFLRVVHKISVSYIPKKIQVDFSSINQENKDWAMRRNAEKISDILKM